MVVPSHLHVDGACRPSSRKLCAAGMTNISEDPVAHSMHAYTPSCLTERIRTCIYIYICIHTCVYIYIDIRFYTDVLLVTVSPPEKNYQVPLGR